MRRSRFCNQFFASCCFYSGVDKIIPVILSNWLIGREHACDSLQLDVFHGAQQQCGANGAKHSLAYASQPALRVDRRLSSSFEGTENCISICMLRK